MLFGFFFFFTREQAAITVKGPRSRTGFVSGVISPPFVFFFCYFILFYLFERGLSEMIGGSEHRTPVDKKALSNQFNGQM